MARVLIFWARPQHLSDEEAEAWVRAELRALPATDGIARAALTRLRSASPHGRPSDWMLELELAAGQEAGWVDSPPWRDWLADLRLLGMRPWAVVADGGGELPMGRE